MRNPGRKFGLGLLSGAGLLSLTALLGTANAETAQYHIAPQPLSEALQAFGVQSGHPMIVDTALVRSKTSRGVVASVDPETALRRLLDGTGLSYKRNGEIFAIVATQAEPAKRTPVALITAAAETVSGSAVEGLVVTAQKKREQIQDVPIAISAFSADALQAQKIEGGFDLLKAIPNVTFSKNNFTSYNFSIRGIGTKAISATTDPGVAVAFNSTGLIQNRLFEQEYFDIERVEVLRGPQGTLYGRNATSGVINVISAKPDLGEFDGSLKGEVGNYHTKRLSGFVNVPLIEDVLAVRFAGALTNREGYDFNSVTDHAVNGRDLWSGRLSIGFEPTENIHADFIWERFNEDDDRSRTGKQLCHRDDGPTVMGETPVVDDPNNEISVKLRPALFSQGCQAGSLYDDAAFGTPNGLALPFVFGILALRQVYHIGYDLDGVQQTVLAMEDPYRGMMQSRNLREIASFRDPRYQANSDVLELNVDFDIGDNLTFTSQTAYSDDTVYSFQDFNRFNTVPIFTDTSALSLNGMDGTPSPWRTLAPGRMFCDPQLGCSNTLAGFDISRSNAEQFSQEFRLQSNFDSALNFSAGANYTKFDALVDYYVFYNLITAYALTNPFYYPVNGEIDLTQCAGTGYFAALLGGFDDGPVPAGAPGAVCPYIDPNPIENINGDGHNYFRSKNPYKLKSAAAFGELYWQASDSVKITAGLRYTDDRKEFIPVPSQILLAPGAVAGGTVSRGYPAKPAIKQHWGEWTGRIGVDWKPDLSFTDETMLYAFYSRGYKGGGANPPSPGFASFDESIAQAVASNLSPAIIQILIDRDILPPLQLTAAEYGPTFEPEFVDAFEVGSKNTLLGGGMTLNTGLFYYDYQDYQVSQIRDRTAVNENFDAKVWGAELESMFAPNEDLQIVFNVGYLDTEIADGETSIDIMNRTQNNPNYVVVKPWVQLPSNCVVPRDVAESYLTTHVLLQNYWQICGGVGGALGIFEPNPPIDPATGEAYDVNDYPELSGGAGIKAQLGGNELPNAPHWTVNLGAQYGWDLLGGEWRATVRGDAYWQAQSWARVYNLDQYDKLHGWYNANLSFWIEKPEEDLRLEFYVKNVLDDTPITDAFLNSDDTALTTNVFTLDPRLIGLQIIKGF